MQEVRSLNTNPKLKIGWASADITPDQPVLLAGQFYARVSEGVLDPVTATALAVESANGEHAIMVSCDLVSTPDGFRDRVRALVKKTLPEIDPLAIFLNNTHTHTAPLVRVPDETSPYGSALSHFYGVELDIMPSEVYVESATRLIAEAAVKAWQSRAASGIGFGLGQAVIGRNRRVVYHSGTARMYGNPDSPEFSHIEGYEDHFLNLLCTFDAQKKLTGIVVNLACPAQVTENLFLISADFWHDTRLELRKRYGHDIFILPQCSAAGDQSPHVLFAQAAEARMLRLKGLTDGTPEKLNSNLGAPMALRKEIALRISDAVSVIMPAITREIEFAPVVKRISETVALPRRIISQKDVTDAIEPSKSYQEQYQTLLTELEKYPEKKKEPRWYTGITQSYRRMQRAENVAKRFELQQKQPDLPVELHVLRIGDLAIATNPFECYLDYGIQIKARSPAVQTLLVQLTGAGSYLPSLRSTQGKGYGSEPASTPIGTEGGYKLVDWTLTALRQLWP